MKSLGGRGRWAVQYVTLVTKYDYENGNSSPLCIVKILKSVS